VSVNGEEVCACWVYARDNEVCANVSLVAEEVLLQEGHAGHDAGFAARA